MQSSVQLSWTICRNAESGGSGRVDVSIGEYAEMGACMICRAGPEIQQHAIMRREMRFLMLQSFI